MTATFASAPAAGFTVYGTTPTRQTAVVGISARARILDNALLPLRYDEHLASGTDNYALNLGLRLSF